MNGAAPEPPRMTNAPRSNIRRITGVSHQRRLCRRKYQNSLKNPRAGASADREKSSAIVCSILLSELSEVAIQRRFFARDIVRLAARLEPTFHGIEEQPQKSAHRQDVTEENN